MAETHICNFCGKEFEKDKVCEFSISGRILTIKLQDYCLSCVIDYFEMTSGCCPVCKQPIVPGEKVGILHNDPRYRHLNCCGENYIFVGLWDESKAKPPRRTISKEAN